MSANSNDTISPQDRLQPPLPAIIPPPYEIVPTYTAPLTPRDYLCTLCGWFTGALLGGAVGLAPSSIFAAKLQMLNPGDSGVIAQLAIFVSAMVPCSSLGLYMGLRLSASR